MAEVAETQEGGNRGCTDGADLAHCVDTYYQTGLFPLGTHVCLKHGPWVAIHVFLGAGYCPAPALPLQYFRRQRKRRR